MSSCLLPTRAVATIADPNFVKIFLSFDRDGKCPTRAAGVIICKLDVLMCIVMCRRGNITPQALRTSFPNLISNRCYPKFPTKTFEARDEGRLM